MCPCAQHKTLNAEYLSSLRDPDTFRLRSARWQSGVRNVSGLPIRLLKRVLYRAAGKCPCAQHKRLNAEYLSSLRDPDTFRLRKARWQSGIRNVSGLPIRLLKRLQVGRNCPRILLGHAKRRHRRPREVTGRRFSLT